MGSINLQGIGKVFSDGTVAVKDVDLDIDDGEFVVLVGPSGCGKTTLLRMIAGLESISSGELRFDNDVINEVSARDRNFAMVFQNYALYPHMTVWQNIAFPLRVHKFPKSEIDQRVREAARILDLSELLERKPKQLSGGQRQRVAMGRAIVRHPGVFLLDEPLSNLDAKLRVQLRAELGRLHARLGVTTIHVTHDQVEAMTLGNRVAVFSKGTLQQYDTPGALYHRPANVFVAGFIGSPAMNFLEAELVEAGVQTAVSIGSAKVAVGPLTNRAVKSGQKLLVGIRPEHLGWRPPGDAASDHLRAQVAFVEHLEPESYVSVSLTDPAAVVRAADEYMGDGADGSAYLADEEAHLVTLRVPADAVPERGAAVDIVIDAERARLFNASTGESL